MVFSSRFQTNNYSLANKDLGSLFFRVLFIKSWQYVYIYNIRFSNDFTTSSFPNKLFPENVSVSYNIYYIHYQMLNRLPSASKCRGVCTRTLLCQSIYRMKPRNLCTQLGGNSKYILVNKIVMLLASQCLQIIYLSSVGTFWSLTLRDYDCGSFQYLNLRFSHSSAFYLSLRFLKSLSK